MKCVVIGDGGIGKTCLLFSYAHQEFMAEYVPTVFDNFTVNIVVSADNQLHTGEVFLSSETNQTPKKRTHRHEEDDKTVISMALWDTAGQEDYHRLRPLAYPDTDIFLMCFSLTHPSSFNNIKSLWVPELQQYCPKTPFILVGLKQDLRRAEFTLNPEELLLDLGQRHISNSAGKELAKEIGALGYIECSALSQHNVPVVFETAARLVLERRSALHQAPRHRRRRTKRNQYEKFHTKVEKYNAAHVHQRRRRQASCVPTCAIM